MDIVEQLEHHASCNAGFDDGELTTKAAAEIKRLRAALTYEEARFGRIGTHGPDCYQWGPGHYECAMREIEQLRQRLHEVSVDWQCSQTREAKLRETLTKISPHILRCVTELHDMAKGIE